MKKSNIELKREYWSQPHLYFTPKMIDAIIADYGEKPATSGEAVYILHARVKDLLKSLPFIRRLL
jgi:hypothetical protein